RQPRSAAAGDRWSRSANIQESPPGSSDCHARAAGPQFSNCASQRSTCSGSALFRSHRKLAGMFVYERGQRFHVFHGSLGQNPVTQVEDVPPSSAGAIQDIQRAGLNLFPIGKKRDWVEIALHRALKTEAPPAFVQG